MNDLPQLAINGHGGRHRREQTSRFRVWCEGRRIDPHSRELRLLPGVPGRLGN
ncbi:MAG TPA: hypothetical protein VK162_17050 [Streptosporangiaceae bacterium]|nr:hypothetical protein [Streptosporangiaceae bacterium]